VSRETVEIVRRSYEAYVRGDLDGALAMADPEIEVYDHDILDAGEYRGIEGLLRWQADWDASWESWQWEAEDFIEAGDRVVAILRVHARGRHSGVTVERLDGAVWTLSGGKAVRLDYYGSKEEALKSVGLEQ
jgi:ketosteroid isomerase-like protein